MTEGEPVAVARPVVRGPDPEEGEPPGTVYVAAVVHDHDHCERFELGGAPAQVIASTIRCAQRLLLQVIDEALAAGQRTTATGQSA